MNVAPELSTRSSLCLKAAAYLAFAVVTVGLFAQTRSQQPISQSELARENMAHVAAPSGQLITVLHKDPGLMVELKRWIAKDATDHGQLISDSDLTDSAIFDRLENDAFFRSVATTLVQKYGYLMPTPDPDSPYGKEQELLIKERVKWIAQDEEEQRNTAHQERTRALQQSQICDPRISNCPPESVTNPPMQQMPQQPGVYQAPLQVPGLQTPQTSPSSPYSQPQQQSPPANDVTQLMRTSGQVQLPIEPGQTTTGMGATNSGISQGLEQERQPDGFSQPGAQGAFQSQLGGSSIEDLSLNSDLAAEGMGTGLSAGAPYENESYSSNSYSTYGTGTYPNGTGTYSNPTYGNTGVSRYGMSTSNAIAMANLLRAKESTTLGQRLVRRPNPYNDIPSLYDMYLQAAAHPPAEERFGMQVFENGTRDLQMLPMDLPAGPDYVLGTGDAVAVDLWGGVSRRFYKVVDREGRISLPEVGPVFVAGKSLADVQESVQKVLRTQFRDVSADVSLARLRSVRVYVVGDVLKPGAYDVGSLSTPLNALFAAGGPTGRGSLRTLQHFRGNQLVQTVDVYDLLLHGVKGDIQRLENGDTVMVPPLGPEITIEGMIRRPAIYELGSEKSLADALALAGGLLPTATLRHIEVQRLIAHQKQTMLSLDLSQDDPSADITKQLDSFQIQDGDKIRVFPIAPYAQDAVYLEGHVIRPGKYSYRDGMRVTDLIGNYHDLLPEPALGYGEIIRLSQPDFRPTVESFNLAGALADPSQSPFLKPLDTVRIFGRYDFENPPVVSVLGDVRAPGMYRTSGDIHLSDAIHLAGGITQDAQTADAQVFRYMPDSTMKILNVKLDSALDGNPTDNIVLQTRDRVLVHRNAAASDPATVYVKGEVVRPGRYPLTAGMKVSDLIQAAGGLKQSADTKAADLTHYVWANDKQVSGQHEPIVLADALAGAPDKDRSLNNGDVLSIRQVQGWEDLGASITLRGEVEHPGSYGIHPGERLSSILLRAGGFAPGAYPHGTVLVRVEVQHIEQQSYGELIQRVREQQANLKLTATTATDPDQKLSAESALAQWQTTMDSLASSPPTGRVAIQISSNIKQWANSSHDVTVRPGDILIVPKRPSYVMVQGQVFGPTAVAYRPGKSARWYLAQAGGPNNMANKKAIFVIRSDGTVVGNHNRLLSSETLGATLQPGDSVVVPEKALGGPPVWKTLFENAQVLSSIATNGILAYHF